MARDPEKYAKVKVTLPVAFGKACHDFKVETDDGRMLVVKHAEIRTNLKDGDMECVLVLDAHSFDYEVDPKATPEAR